MITERELFKRELQTQLPDLRIITEPTDMQWILDDEGRLLAVLSDARVLRNPELMQALSRSLDGTLTYFALVAREDEQR